MRVSKRTRWVTSVGLVGALGIGAAVGLVGSAGAASGPTTSATHAGTPVSTVSFKFEVSVGGLTPSAVTVTGQGQADLAHRAGWLTADLPAAVATLLPGGTAAPERVKVVVQHGTVYLDVPGLAAVVGKPWISVALPTRGGSAATGILAKVGKALGDVDALVHLAQSHHATVTSLGTSTVDGVTATGHKIVLALTHRKVALTASVWADGSDRLVQADLKAGLTLPHRSAQITARVDLGHYGGPVTIPVPPPSQVKSIPLATVTSFLGHPRHHHGLDRLTALAGR